MKVKTYISIDKIQRSQKGIDVNTNLKWVDKTIIKKNSAKKHEWIGFEKRKMKHPSINKSTFNYPTAENSKNTAFVTSKSVAVNVYFILIIKNKSSWFR